MKITDVSIDNRTSVFILVFIIIIAGTVSYVTLPRESSPDVQIPLVIVSAPYFGVSPEDIESLITQPLEKELNTITDVKKIQSSSYEGYSIIQLEFEIGYDIDEAIQKVREKVDKAEPELPEDLDKPIITEINISEFPILYFTIAGDIGLVKLKDIAEDMKDDIENIDGVLEVGISGGLEREVKVNVDINKLLHFNVTFDDIISAIANENRTIPSGTIDINDESFLIRVPGEFDEPYIISDLIIKSENGYPIYLKDVAQVNYDFKEQSTYSRLNGVEGISVSVSKRIGANIIDIADEVKLIISEYEQKLGGNVNFTVTVDQSKDIRRSVKNLENNIFSGLVLVLIVLFTLLGVRNAFFVAIAIPLSMLISFVILSLFGITLNFIVLFSLILALGMLVDNAIVIIENIYKFLEEGKPLIEAAKEGAKEVAWPITTSTLTTLTAFAPMLFWPDIIGDFMKYLPITLIVTLSSSLFVALVINPVFASVYMKLETEESRKSFLGRITAFFNGALLEKSIAAYEKILRNVIGNDREKDKPISFRNILGIVLTFLLLFFVIMLVGIPEVPNYLVFIFSVIAGLGILLVFKNPRLRVISSTFLLLILIMLIYFEFDHGVELFPETDPPTVRITVEAPVGTNLDMSDKIVRKVEEKLTPFLEGDVKDVVVTIGLATDDFGGSQQTEDKSQITIQYVDYEDREKSSIITTEEIRKAIFGIAGAEIEISKQAEGPPVGAPVSVEIIGEDYKILGDISEKVKAIIDTIPGIVDLQDNYESGRPEVRVEINRERASLYNLSTTQIANTVRTAVNGYEASTYRVNEDEYDITVRLKEDQRASVDALENLKINFMDKGKLISLPLNSVADIIYGSGPGAIKRKNLDRVITVSSNVEPDFNDTEVLNNVKKALSNFNLPDGYKFNFTGQNEEQEKSAAFLSKAFLIAILGIFLILVIQFNSLSQPLIIMAAVMISLIGVFIGLTAFAMPFGIIMTGIGIISLAGVVVNNNIVLIDYINILRKNGATPAEAAIGSGIRRFRPVTLTAITTILGLIPLTFGFGFDLSTFSFESGGTEAAFWKQMGVAVIFGLMFGTILTLIIVPVIYTTIQDLPDAIKSTLKRKKN